MFKKNSKQKDNWALAKAENPETGSISIFLKNLEPIMKIGDTNYPYVAYITFHYNKYNNTGLPDTNDTNTFSEIENNDLLVFEENGLSIHLASVTQDGIRDYIFQTSNPEKFLNLTKYIKNNYPQYNVECEIIKDPKWEHYIDLPGD